MLFYSTSVLYLHIRNREESWSCLILDSVGHWKCHLFPVLTSNNFLYAYAAILSGFCFNFDPVKIEVQCHRHYVSLCLPKNMK